MSRETVHASIRMIAGLACVSMLLSCEGNARLFGATTYRPSFRAFGHSTIETVMWRLAGHVHELESLTRDPEAEIGRYSTILMQIEDTARSLESDGGGANHPYFKSELAKFLAVVEGVNQGLKHSPTETAVVDEVWRACTKCHAR